MKKISNYIVIIIFFIMIILPQVLFVFVGKKLPVDNSEKRKLAEKPKFKIENIENYSLEFDNYYNDNLPFRSIIRKLWTNFNFYILNESTTDSVLIGKNDGDRSLTWLFFQGNDGANPVEETQGRLTFSEEEKNKISDKIVLNTQKLAEKNIEVFFVIMPNKENLYREKFPDSIKIYENETRTEKLINYLQNDLKMKNVIYIKDALEEAKKENLLYYRQDTHWNDYGAFIGFKDIVSKIEDNYNNFEHKVEYSEEMILQKDLSDMLGIKSILKDVEPTVKFMEEKSYYEEVYETVNRVVITECEDPEIDKTVIIVGDSFRLTMIPYFSKLYKKVVYIHRCEYQNDLIEKYNPDIIICQVLERYVNSLQEINLY